VQDASEQWNDYVVRHLLPRLWGQELLLPPLVLAHLALGARLGEYGFRFDRPGRLHLYLGNTLQQPHVGDAPNCCSAGPFTVVVGNPPFSGISENRQAWIRQLLRGRAPGSPQAVADYFLTQGQPLGERKHWLEDDYVKFMRFAHWQIEQSGSGIVALVTNHGYLENATFRGMREQLLATFPLVDVVDLHGNSRNADRTPQGSSDESLFGIEQGVAVSFLRRPRSPVEQPHVRRADVWGTHAVKTRTLANHSAQTLPHAIIRPQPPFYFLASRASRPQPEYDAGFRLSDAMATHSTAVVTARDGFIVAFNTDELCERIEQFVDPQYTDDQIRRRFFGNGRSRKYPPGDTRGWQVANARRRLRQHANWKNSVRSCLYRPFDRRQILWLPWMIDWPRREVMDHLSPGGNLALIARRQMPPGKPCDYFWVTDRITLDGVVRSDNRGSESVFPLYVLEKSPAADGFRESDHLLTRRPNFSEPFIEFAAGKLQLDWTPEAPHDLLQYSTPSQLTPACLFYYIYGLFHCPSYRRRFAERLQVGFPHILIPRHVSLFTGVAATGHMLVRTHLLAADQAAESREAAPSRFALVSSGNTIVESGYPKYAQQAVWLNSSTRFATVSLAVWQFRVGTYQVCRKWLVDRRQRSLTAAELEHYAQLLSAVDTTIRTTTRLEQLIESHGGWERSF
jgi:predicted helicase